MLVHRLRMRLGPATGDLFSCVFIALQSGRCKGVRKWAPILFLFFSLPWYQSDAGEGGRGMLWCWALSVELARYLPFLQWGHKPIPGGWRSTVSAPSASQGAPSG